jgi:31-O-methyltransferase
VADSRKETWSTPDGRLVVCPSRNEARELWSEIDEVGPFADAVRALRPGELVLDVGAHVGLSTLYMSGCRRAVRVLAFEPAPVLHAYLSENLRRHVPGGVALRLAVGSGTGKGILSYRPLLPAISTLSRNDSDERRMLEAKFDLLEIDEETRDGIRVLQSVEENVPVRVTTVTATLEAQGADDEVGLLKIDAERAELDVMAGISERCWPRIRQLLVDVHDVDGRLDHVLKLLRDKGYAVSEHQEHSFAGSSIHTVLARRGGNGVQ